MLAPLRMQLPSVALFQGPVSVGKWTVAMDLAHSYADPCDLLAVDRLDVDAAREIVGFTGVRSLVGDKAVVCRLDGASPQATNRLLKVLEEPPPSVHFILCTSTRPMLTIASRASSYLFGYLTEAEVEAVLVAVLGWTSVDAEWAASRSGGQISRALEAGDMESTKQAVKSLLRGAATGDVALVTNSLVKFSSDPEHPDRAGRLLAAVRQWALEARTGHWRMFSAAESYGLHTESTIVERVMRVTTSGARPRVAARAAFMPIAVSRNGGTRVG